MNGLIPIALIAMIAWSCLAWNNGYSHGYEKGYKIGWATLFNNTPRKTESIVGKIFVSQTNGELEVLTTESARETSTITKL